MAVEHIPLDSNGNWDTYARSAHREWTENVPFSAEMEITGMYSGRSAKGARLIDLDTGDPYHMFMIDLIKAIQNHTVVNGVFPRMDWEGCKRGTNYGVRPVAK